MCQLCPWGTYKPNTGERFSDCLPCPPFSSFSTSDRRTCTCFRMDGGSTDYTALYFDPLANACVERPQGLVDTDDSLHDSVLTRHAESPCPRGFYCTGGVRFPCPAGRFGGRTEETDSECEGICAEGFWCPEGSWAPTQNECGTPAFYCPRGAPHSLPAQPGYYTNEDAEIGTRSRRIMCPKGGSHSPPV